LTWSDKHSSDTDDNGLNDAVDDPDGDGLTTGDEFVLGTDRFDTDTDDDGIPDG
jgi:hypothetical protein